MTNKQYHAFLDLMMCSDPWPIVDQSGFDYNEILEQLADEEARKRGFDNWIEAFHKF